ncbi:neuropeptide Y receptor type 2-like [Montipora foliosa]|uniref:neuropeptide Y receptor type 2-like n=1 Tax=Montipora foliosa TaxID=591990 RepID=UPI0035F17A9E
MQQHYEQWTATTLFVCPLYLLTIIVGSLGNGMVIYSYATDKTIHRTFNFLITNLAIADLILSLLFTPLLFIYRVHAKSELISFTPMCEISIFLSMLSISMMYLVFPLLAYHRKDVMLRPQQPKLNLAQARLVVYMFWILSAIAAVMMILIARREFSSDDSIPKLFRCLLINQDLDKYAQAFLLYSASLYGLSIAISAVLYFMIFRLLGQHLEGVNGSAEERHCTKLCFWVAIVYTAFWTPFLLVQLGGVFGKYSEVHFNLHGCSSAIGVIGSAVNPLLYAIMNPYYKEKLYCLYKRVTCRG